MVQEPTANPFDGRAWDALAAEDARGIAPPPPPPEAPVLPFTFMGKLIDPDRVIVFASMRSATER